MKHTTYQSVKEPVQRNVLTVSRLNSEVRAVLEGSFPLLWVEGEISNLAQPPSGHIYFTLKDRHAQVRCAMFRMKRQRLRFMPENGIQVLLRGRVGLYEGRGEFQLIAEHMEPAGEGALRRAFDALKEKLSAEGLFDTDVKKPLPAYPSQIGIITSPTGAAVRDILTVLKRRFPAAGVVIYPVQVQGNQAPSEIETMIRLAERRAECDLLIIARGGGSLEDLAAFNDESVARAIYATSLPIVSAVGHEIDFTIADFVADQRAATPSAAAELVSPDRIEVETQIDSLAGRLLRQFQQRLEKRGSKLQNLHNRLFNSHPGNRIMQWQQRMDELQQRLHHAINNDQRHRLALLNTLAMRFAAGTPVQELRQLVQRRAGLNKRLVYAIETLFEQHRLQLAKAAANLHALSPLATLERGYSITRRAEDGSVIQDATGVAVGERVETLLARGSLTCEVISTSVSD